jgi:asparagine synthase (glutamine-hydrolysing)
MLALENIRKRSGALAGLAPWAARLTPSEKLRHYMRMCGQPLETRYRGVTRGLSAEVRRRLLGQYRVEQSEEQLQAIFGGHFQAAGKASPLNRMLYVDAKVWLPDDLLIKADKMTMANGLELRVPFLDHKMVEFAATLPQACKISRNRGKALLRTAMRGVIPDAIIDRPKQGFPIPIGSWLRTSLRQFTRDHLLAPDSACSRYVDRKEVVRFVDEHENHSADRSQEIWTLLVFEFWHRHFIRNPSSAEDGPTPAPLLDAQRAACGEPT